MYSAGETTVKTNTSATTAREELLGQNDWSDSDVALHYKQADLAAGENPSIAQKLDGNDDGELTRDEFEAGRELLAEYDVVDGGSDPFVTFKRFAQVSLERPEDAREAGVGDVIVPEKTGKAGAIREQAYSTGMMLMSEAAKEKGYDEATNFLSQAGQLFMQFGFEREAKRCRRFLIERAEANGRHEDVAFQKGLIALGNGNVGQLEEQLNAIPEDFAGREVLADYADTYRNMERMAHTFAAAEAIVEDVRNDAENDYDSYIGNLKDSIRTIHPTSYRNVLKAAIEGWCSRLKSGKFESTREILEDLWEEDEMARRGIAYLAGYQDAMRDDLEFPAKLEYVLLEMKYARRVTLFDIVDQEERPAPAKLTERLSLISSEGCKNMTSAVASVYQTLPGFRSEMSEFIDEEFIDPGFGVKARDAAKGLLDPTNLAIMVGGFALARLTTAAIMARFAPVGVEGLTLASRVGVEATEAVIEAGGFTVYQRLLSSLLTTQPVDWDPRAIAKDWASLALSFGFLRASNVPLQKLRQGMARTKTFAKAGAEPVVIGGRTMPALNGFGKVLYKITENATHTAAFYSGGAVGYGMNLRDVPPHLIDEWIMLLQFQIATRAANYASNGALDRTAHKLRTKPIADAAQAIAEGIAGGRGQTADGLAQCLFHAHVKGDVSRGKLVDIARAFKRGNADSKDVVIEINLALKATELPIVYDGAKLYEVPVKIRDAFIAELEGMPEGGRKDGPEPAYATAGVSDTSVESGRARDARLAQVLLRDGDSQGSGSERGASPKSSVPFKEALGRYNEQLKSFDEAASAKRQGQELTREQQALLDNPRLKALDVKRAEYIQRNCPELASPPVSPFPQFQKRVDAILANVPAQKKAEARRAIEDAFESVPSDADKKTVGRTLGPLLKAIEARFVPRSTKHTKAEIKKSKREARVREARERLKELGVLTPEVEAEIASFESWGGDAVKGRVADALLSAAGHQGEDTAIRAYTSLEGLLFEIVRRREAAETLKLDAASRNRYREKTRYHALRRTPNGLEVVERASPSESDVPEVPNIIYELKSTKRLNFGTGNDGEIRNSARNQAIKYSAEVSSGAKEGATIEVKGNVSPLFVYELGRLAPEVEVLYNLPLLGGAEIVFRIKEAPPSRPTLRRVPDIRALPETDQKIVDGIRKVMQTGRLLKEGVLENDFLKLGDVSEAHPHRRELGEAARDDGSIDPVRIKNLEAFKAWERLTYFKRLRYFMDQAERTPLRRSIKHLKNEVTPEAVDEYLAKVDRFLERASTHLKRQYTVSEPEEYAQVRQEFARRLAIIREFEMARLSSPEEQRRHQERVSLGYTGWREGYPLDPIHIYMDVVKGLRELGKRGEKGDDAARGARSYDREWLTAEEALSDLLAGKYAQERRMIRIVYPEYVTPDVGEQITNAKEYEVMSDAEAAAFRRKSHQRNMTRIKRLKEKLLRLGDSVFEESLSENERDCLREIFTALRTHGVHVHKAERRLQELISRRNRKFAELDADRSIPKKKKNVMKGVIARKYKDRIEALEYELLGAYERALGVKRYRSVFEYVEREWTSDTVKFIYTVDSAGKVRMVEEGFRPGSERPAHSELAKGLNVYGAGQIYIQGTPVETGGRKQIRVLVIDDGSGHYRPDTLQMLPYVKNLLERYGYDVVDVEFKHAPLPVVPLSDSFDVPVQPWFANGNGKSAVGNVVLRDPSSKIVLSSLGPRVIERMAGELHDAWREPRRVKGSDRFEPRMKKTEDAGWIERHGTDEVDIANTHYRYLPSDWKAENKASAEVAVGEVMLALKGGRSLDADFIERASDVVHEKWLERNGERASEEHKKPYRELSEAAKEMDRVIVRHAISVAFEMVRAEYAKRVNSPERAELHEGIVTKLLEDGDVSDKPQLVFTAGAPGAGKSTAVDALDGAKYLETKKYLLIDPDAIKEMLPEYELMKRIDASQAASTVHKESGDIQEIAFHRALALNKNTIVDGTLRATDYFSEVIKGVRREHPNYSVSIVYVDASERALLDRVASRAKKTGRHVPESFVVDTKKIVRSSVEALRKLADAQIEIDNETKPVIKSFYKDGETVTVNLSVPMQSDPTVSIDYRVSVSSDSLSSDTSVGTVDQIKGAKRVIRIQSGPSMVLDRLRNDLLSNLDANQHWIVVRADDPKARPLLEMARDLGYETIVISTADEPPSHLNGLPTFYSVVPSKEQFAKMWDELITKDQESRVEHIGLDFGAELAEPLDAIARRVVEDRRVSHARLRGDLNVKGIEYVEMSDVDDSVLKGRTPILFSGASASSWPKISPPQQAEVIAAIEESLSLLDPAKTVIVTGGTNYGVEMHVHEIASRMGFTVLGTFVELASTDAQEIGPVTHAVEMGNSWYGKARPVLRMIAERKGLALFIGGGGILKNEIQMARDLGVDFRLMDGPEGAANDLVEALPEKAFVGRDGLVSTLFRSKKALLRSDDASVREARDAMFRDFAKGLEATGTQVVSYAELQSIASGYNVRVLGGYSGLGYESPEAVKAHLRTRMERDGDGTMYVIGGTSDGIGEAYTWIPEIAAELGYKNVRTAGIVSRNAAKYGVAAQDYIVFVDTAVNDWEVIEGGRSLMVGIAEDTGGQMIYYRGGGVSAAEIGSALQRGVPVTIVAAPEIAPSAQNVAKKLIGNPRMVTDGTAKFIEEANLHSMLTIEGEIGDASWFGLPEGFPSE